MKSLTLLWNEVAADEAALCATSALRDCKTVAERVEHEGLSFITITLPGFGKDFEKSLDQGRADRNLFQGFSWQAGLPRFLGGFLDLVFDRTSGVLLDNPSTDAIRAVRQLTLMFSKIALPCSDARTKRAIDGYVECEKEVRVSDASVSKAMRLDFQRVADLLFTGFFTDVDREVYNGEVIPKHGPGATADGFRGNGKYRQDTWPARLEKVFPATDYLIPSPSYYDELERIHLLEPGSEIPAKVITVPKTLKTPRIIAEEPTAMQYVQQGILELMMRHLKRDDILYQMLGFDDQEPNQLMAREGSACGSLATLDMSEASDRVSNQQVRDLLRNHGHLHAAVDASRSRKADVDGHGVIRLAKFASMGSALCFPFEAMVFLTMIFIGIERELGTPLSKRTIRGFLGQVRVYGDDIVIPVDYVESVIEVLEAFGSRVNRNKSFWTGKFRESCGKEYYDGVDVSIVRVRRTFPAWPTRDPEETISLVSLRNQLYWAGLWQACKWLDSYIGRTIKYFPIVGPKSPVLGRQSVFSPLDNPDGVRIGKHLHNPIVKGYRVAVRLPSDRLDGPGAMLKCFLKRGSEPIADSKHLERAGRPKSANIRLGWAPAL